MRWPSMMRSAWSCRWLSWPLLFLARRGEGAPARKLDAGGEIPDVFQARKPGDVPGLGVKVEGPAEPRPLPQAAPEIPRSNGASCAEAKACSRPGRRLCRCPGSN